ncbi:uncharacterized protein LOC131952523 [Physella acuta]|uniref:uncharacterized protein LOC131952523 n=1 Tax=Physella acuta TaxID=109671 RepID=UPI0027DE02E3|nr:uncharacterized protein LOC131952523 [Physella acuta]
METGSTDTSSRSFTKLFKSFSQPSVPLLNGYVAHQMYHSNGATVTKVSKILTARNDLASAGYQRVAAAVRKVMADFKRHRRNGISHWDQMVSFMFTPFSVQPLPDYSQLLRNEMLGEMTAPVGDSSVAENQLSKHKNIIPGHEEENEISMEVKREIIDESNDFVEDRIKSDSAANSQLAYLDEHSYFSSGCGSLAHTSHAIEEDSRSIMEVKTEMAEEMSDFVEDSAANCPITFLTEHNYFISGGEEPSAVEEINKNSMDVKSEVLEDRTDLVEDRSDFIEDRNDFIGERSDFMEDRNDFVGERSDFMEESSDFIEDSNDFVEDRSESVTISGYKLRGNRYSRRVIRSKSIIRYKDKIKKLRQEKRAMDEAEKKEGKDNYAVPIEVRQHNLGSHWPVFADNRGRCKMCSIRKIQSRPFSKCTFCDVFLCVNEKKNCFRDFHLFY